MNKISTLKTFLTSLAIAAAPFSAAMGADLTPDILHPDPLNGALLYGLSDNGDWGVTSMDPGSVGFYDFAGAKLFDLRSNPVKITNLSEGHVFASALDVTDDGLTVAGSVDQKPAICRYEDGKWVWHTLPVSNRHQTVYNEFTGYEKEYVYDGGEVTGITPDGRFAVGLCSSIEYGQLEHGYMWDLADPENPVVVDLPSSVTSRLNMISADGRYVVSRSQVWDRELGTVTRVPLALDIYAQGMSTSGRYFSGVTERNDSPYASVWDRETNKLTVYDRDIYADAVAWTVTNEGVPLVARPHIALYADGFVFHNGFLYSFKELYEDVYGLNLRQLGMDITGKPFKVSADGRTIVFITEAHNSYVLRLKEDLTEALERIDLFNTWNASPANGAKITGVKNVAVTFAHPVELNPEAGSEITLLDAEGNAIAYPVANGGLEISGTNVLNIYFRARTLEEGKDYTLLIPEGTVSIAGIDNYVNPELRIKYTGRGNYPVKPTRVSPEEGSLLASLSLSDNPVVVRFDTKVAIGAETVADRPIAKVYIDDDPAPVARLNMDVDLNTGYDLVLFPDNALAMYEGSEYRIVVPEGAVTDLSGYGASEEFTITYRGSYVPELGDEIYLFRSDCNDYTNFLFYEGDHGEPVQEYQDMFFTRDETPWLVVREDENSDDMAFGSHSCYTDGRQSDDWVTTRQILIPEDTETYLAFDSQSYRKSKQDYLKVYVYENATIFNSISESRIADIKENAELIYHELQSPGATEAGLSGEWTHNVIDLSRFAGKPVYICFHNDNRNQSLVMIDNIEVVKNVKAFLTIRNKENVVNESEATIRGILTVADETTAYSTIELSLRDSEGNEVSAIREGGLDLKAGDTYNFEFPEALPLEYGVENAYTINYSLDNTSLTYEGLIRNLTFEPVRRVVIEEFTGRDCQYCPGGILAMEHLEALYGDRIVPIALHCYNGTDPKGINVMGYWEFTGMGAAPQARIDRGPVSGPLYNTPSGYTFSGAAYGEMLWKDYVLQEFDDTPLLEVEITPQEASDSSTLPYTATVRSAVSRDNVRIRVFAVLLEDGLRDYQVNGYSSTSDPLLGEWGQGGTYGRGIVYLEFDNVARGIWGSSYNGVGGLLPSTLQADQEYKIDIDMPVPSIVENIDNCKVALMLIDESTGKVVNACMSTTSSGVDAPEAETEDMCPAVYYNLQGIPVINPTSPGIYIRNGKKVVVK